MMVHFKYIDCELPLADDCAATLVVENKKLLRRVLCSFFDDCSEEYFTFSDNFKPFDFSKKGMFIPNILDIDQNSKRLLTKINSYLASNAETEFPEILSKARSELLNLADNLVRFIDFDCCYKSELTADDIVGLLNFRIGNSDTSEAQKLIYFVTLVSKYLNTQLFVLPFFHTVFDEDEAELIFDTLFSNHIRLLLIESAMPAVNPKCEKLFVVDKDLCQITN